MNTPRTVSNAWSPPLLHRAMNMIDYRAIQLSEQEIVAARIDRQLRSGCGDHLAE